MLGTTIVVLMVGSMMLWHEAIERGRWLVITIGSAVVLYSALVVFLGRRSDPAGVAWWPFAAAGVVTGAVAELINAKFLVTRELFVAAADRTGDRDRAVGRAPDLDPDQDTPPRVAEARNGQRGRRALPGRSSGEGHQSRRGSRQAEVPHPGPGASARSRYQLAELKALFFVKDLVGNSARNDILELEPSDGRARGSFPIEVEFADGERLVGLTVRYPPIRPFFFILPADSRSNNVRVLVNRAAVKRMSQPTPPPPAA